MYDVAGHSDVRMTLLCYLLYSVGDIQQKFEESDKPEVVHAFLKVHLRQAVPLLLEGMQISSLMYYIILFLQYGI